MDMVRHMAGGEARCGTARFRAKPRAGSGEEGVALMVVLLFILLLSVIVVEFAYEMQVEASLAMNMNRDFQAYIAAKSAIAVGMELLQADLMQDQIMNTAPQGRNPPLGGGGGGGAGQNPDEMYDALTDAWALGVPDQALNDAVMRCRITDECGKLNLNALVTPDGQKNDMLVNALRKLFANLGVEEDPTDAILDWVDPDDNEEPAGAESGYYDSLETPYTCKNGPMDSIEELLLIAGIPAEFYFDAQYFVRGKDMDESEEELEPVSLPDLLTVHGNPSGAVNINTAHPEALAALMDNGAVVEDILQRRLEEPYTSPPVDPGVPKGAFVVQSNVFRIFGDGQAGDVMVRVEAYVFRLGNLKPLQPPNGGPKKPPDKNKELESFRILDWRVIR